MVIYTCNGEAEAEVWLSYIHSDKIDFITDVPLPTNNNIKRHKK